MKTVLIYASVHHKNTEQLVKAIAAAIPETLLLDTASVKLKDLDEFDVIGIASGIYFGKMHKSLLQFVHDNLPDHKKTFILYTSGQANELYGTDVKPLIEAKRGEILGTWNCRGWDTFGPFKLIGGLQKGHPTADEIADAVNFVKNLLAPSAQT